MSLYFKSVFQPAYRSYQLIQFRLPCISSLRYKSVGVQKKVKTYRYKSLSDTPETLLIKELEEETDFMSVPTPEHIKDQYEFRKLEMDRMENKNYLKSIEYKYFRDFRDYNRREPNLLTWAMKEHLINLHNIDPENWTVETLSYAFPASPFRVKELLGTKLNTPSEKKLKRHDEEVLKNWKTLCKGKFGSIGLLKKIISQRIMDIGGETLPAQIGDVTQRTKNLIFTPIGEVLDEEEILSTPVEVKKHFWFRDIITKYEERKLLAGSDSSTTAVTTTTTTKDNENIELQKCKNLDDIKSIRGQNYDDQLPSVQIRHCFQMKSGKKSKQLGRKFITYEEFLKKKK